MGIYEVFPGLHRPDDDEEDKLKTKKTGMSSICDDLKVFAEVFKSKTFLILILQGVCGAYPWSGLQWLMSWYEYMGMTSILKVLLFFCAGGGAAVGGLIGGLIGDRVHKISPRYGRLIVGQISVLMG